MLLWRPLQQVTTNTCANYEVKSSARHNLRLRSFIQ